MQEGVLVYVNYNLSRGHNNTIPIQKEQSAYGGRISAAMKIFSTSSDRMLRRCAKFRFTSSFLSNLEGFS